MLVEDYRRVADVFAYINEQKEHVETMNVTQLCEQFNTSLVAIGYVQKHLNNIIYLNNIVYQVIHAKNNDFINKLNADEKKLLENHLKISLEEFVEINQGAVRWYMLLICWLHPACKNSYRKTLTHLILIDPELTHSIAIDLLNSSEPFREDEWLILSKAYQSDEEAESIASAILQREEINDNQFLVSRWNQLAASNYSEIACKKLLVNKQVLDRLMNHEIFEMLAENNIPSLLRFLTDNYPDKFDDKWVKKSKDFGFLQELLDCVLSEEFFEKIDDSFLIELLQQEEKVFSEEEFDCLIKISKTPEQIFYLLSRPEMTSDKADVLFNKPMYNYQIDDWEWLSEDQLVEILNKTADFSSFSKALTHQQLSPAKRDDWHQVFQKARNQQSAIEGQLEALKILAGKHLLEGNRNPDYIPAAKAAFELYQVLKKETTHYFSDQLTRETYLANCQNAIQNATLVLNTHRGYKQQCLDLLNRILFTITHLTFAAPEEKIKWRFFEANTRSMDKVKLVGECIRMVF